MISYSVELNFEFSPQNCIKNITEHVRMCLIESQIQEGLVIVSAQHTTFSIFINDDEQGLINDIQRILSDLAPSEPSTRYQHNMNEDDAHAHLRQCLLGRSEIVSVTAGKLDLGLWEQIFCISFHGNRTRKIKIKIIGE